ncbi:MAG: hypothetical protein QG588_1956, partial [Candidatus Poribacteria bacterium]|nr:hypothetical protein [Candidatus Poribacteria bacterium]
KIYAIGGYILLNGPISLATVEMYDPKTDIWTNKADMLTAKAYLSTSVVNGKIYAIGGAGQNAPLSIVEEYTPEDWQSAVYPQGKLPTTWGKKKQNQ